MGELVRRLDYERRSKQKFHLAGSQRINREYSTPVRSANAMEERKKQLLLERTELHTRLFLSRHEYERKVVEHFQDELEVKSQNFSEEKFQELQRRAQSARPRLQQGEAAWAGPVVEIVPREYYRSETRTPGVTFKDQLESESDEEEGEEEEDVKLRTISAKSGEDQKHMNRTSGAAAPLSLALKVRMSRRSSVQYLKRRRISLAHTTDKQGDFDLRCLPARLTRRKSAPPRSLAFIPPDSISIGAVQRPDSRSLSRRGSRSSLGSVSEMSELSDSYPAYPSTAPTRSYRVLREAFKKQRKEKPDPSKERFDAIKKDHLVKDELLREHTLERFEKIFAGHDCVVY